MHLAFSGRILRVKIIKLHLVAHRCNNAMADLRQYDDSFSLKL